MHPRRFVRFLKSACLGAAGCAALAAAHANVLVLPPCGSAALPGTTPFAGLVVHDELIPFEVRDSGGALLYGGNLQSRVILLNSTGRLAFAYRVRDTVVGIPGAVDELSTESFAGFTTDVDYSPTSLGTMVPDGASRSCDGSRVDFEYTNNLIRAGSSSKFVIVGTEAELFAPGGSTTIFLRSGESVVVPTVQPVIDETPPVVTITTPAALECVCNPAQIIGTVNDPESGISSWTLEHAANPAGPWTTIATGTTAVVNGVLGTWNTGPVANGYHFLRLRAENGLGMTESFTTTVWVDKQFDSFEFRWPVTGAVRGGTLCPDGTAWDHCFDHYTVDFRPSGGGTYQPVNPGSPVYTSTMINDPFTTWDTIGNGVVDGMYDVRVVGTDICGNTQSAVHQIIVDNTPPTAEITNPLECNYFCGIINVTGTANDANLGSWVLQYTGGSQNGWVTISSGTSPVVNGVLGLWDTSQLSTCAYTLRLVVWDTARVNCTVNTHRSEFAVSLNVGPYADCDGNGTLDLFDFLCFQNAFVNGCP